MQGSPILCTVVTKLFLLSAVCASLFLTTGRSNFCKYFILCGCTCVRNFDVASLLRKDAALESYSASYLSSSYQDDQSFYRSYKLCDVTCVVVSENDRNQSHRMCVTVFTVFPSTIFMIRFCEVCRLSVTVTSVIVY
jgi:hypothetical protein